MKNLAESIRNFDREQARRVAHNLPEQYTEREQTQQVAQIINGLFVQLAAAFPASLVNRSQEDVNEIRRQWVLAFKENGITTMEQVEAGMRMVRRSVHSCRHQASSSSGAGKGAAYWGSPPLT
jgi:predicted Co/Zn/Cd cation transporter (cation efflux family)